MIGVEVLQVEGPDPRNALPNEYHPLHHHHRLLAGRSLFGGGGSPLGSGDSGTGGGAGLAALTMPMMLQLRCSKDALCKIRPRKGGDEGMEASLTTLAQAGDGRGGVGRGMGVGAGSGTASPSATLALVASVQPLAKLAQLRSGASK